MMRSKLEGHCECLLQIPFRIGGFYISIRMLIHMSRLANSPFSSVRVVIITFDPIAANCRAVSKFMPLLNSVTTNTFVHRQLLIEATNKTKEIGSKHSAAHHPL
jgi:hypothetical protein